MAPVRSIVVVGGGLAGSMSALALARALAGTGRTVTLVESDGPDRSLGSFGPGETSLPAFRDFLAGHGLGEDAVLRAARGCFSLGTAVTGFAAGGGSAFLPFAEAGAPLGSVAFHQLAARLRAAGRTVRLADFSLAAMAAQEGRFARPPEDPRSVLSTLGYGLHLDRALLADVFRNAALGQGARLAPAPFRAAIAAPDGGVIALALGDGSELAGDLFLDCTGPDRRVIEAAGSAAWQSWAQWLPCDRAIERRDAAPGVPPPYAHAGAHGCGWRRTVPLADGQGSAFLWHSDHLDDAGAQHGFGGGEVVRFESGRLDQPWQRNCVALGAAAVMLEPLHPTGLHLLQRALARLVALFPASTRGAEAAEYNRIVGEEADRARDFAILPYKANGRVGEPFWDSARAAAVPDALQRKLDLFASRGRVPVDDEESFDAGAWIAALDGLGVRPRHHDLLADTLPEAAVLDHFARLRRVMTDAVPRIAAHGATLRSIEVLP